VVVVGLAERRELDLRHQAAAAAAADRILFVILPLHYWGQLKLLLLEVVELEVLPLQLIAQTGTLELPEADLRLAL
jgi:hypothetical protein